MKKIFRSLLFLSLLFLLAKGLSLTGCGGGVAPPASIPAPVSSLMVAGEPTGGVSTVSGAPGAAEPNATVQAVNATQGGVFTWWESLLISTAVAQPIAIEVTTLADDLGAFNFQIQANSGDDILIRQEVNGEVSPEITIRVPCGGAHPPC